MKKRKGRCTSISEIQHIRALVFNASLKCSLEVCGLPSSTRCVYKVGCCHEANAKHVDVDLQTFSRFISRNIPPFPFRLHHDTTPMSTSLLRSLPPSRQYERHLQRCAQQFLLRDDLRPLRSNNPIPSRQCLRQRQPFSSTSLRPAAGKVMQPKIKQKAQPSMTVTRKQQEAQVISRGAIPDDVGLMDQTFIMPHGKNKPSWLKDFNMRWRLEKHRLKTRVFEIFQ